MLYLKNITKIFLITLFLFFFTDFFFGERILKKFKIIYLEELLKVSNEDYGYSFKSNINTNFAVWGNTYYKLCTDSRGFKFNCKDKEIKNYDIAFIGDSFTEGIALPFEKTFVGKFKEKTNLDIVNLGVSSYSPDIYVKKTKYLVSNKIILFDHLIVGIDLTDLEDDWKREIKKTRDTLPTNSRKKFQFKLFLAKNLPTTYLILKKINWYIKIELIKNVNVNHLDYSKNKASWSYIANYKKLDEKIKNQTNNMDELFDFLKDNNIKLSILIFPHQASIKYDIKDSLYKKIWKDYCINKCFKFIDAYSIFFDEIDNFSKEQIMKKYYIEGDPHFNEKGNEVVYKILLKNLNY
tara:strand:- start:1906 stop:2958 length:1053 start_codon:yes stop_codon:yes gene_type:complete